MEMTKFVIGAYIGDTTTNTVILHGRKVVAKASEPTAQNNLKEVVEAVIDKYLTNDSSNTKSLTRRDVINCTERMVVGISHFMTALIERKGLCKVSVIRLCGSDTRALPPFVNYPERLKHRVNGGYGLLQGGFECTKKEIGSISEVEIAQKVEELWSESATRNFVVCGVFSPLDHSQEHQAASIIRSLHPDASVTESHLFSHCGLLEREDAAILNESLKPLCSDIITELRKSLNYIGFPQSCSLYLIQNDGTLICENAVKKLPLLTAYSSPACAMRGAAFLSGVDDAIVIDIGETTTNVGIIKSGLPCMSNDCFQLPDVNVRTKLYHPIMISISLGKKSVVTRKSNHNEVNITKDHLAGANSKSDAVVPNVLLTPLSTPMPKLIDPQTAYGASMQVYKMIGKAIEAIKTSPQGTSVLLVGEGSVIVDTDWMYKDVDSLQRTPHYDVADAVGAAVGKISGEYQEVVPASKLADNVDQLIEQCITKAKYRAIANGAIPCSLIVAEKHIDQGIGIYIKVVGDLNENFMEVSDMKTDPEDESPPKCKKTKVEENPSWPFKNKEAANLDKQFGLPEPTINSSGEWVLTASDIECVCIGAGILGSGGGGSPYIGELIIKNLISEGNEVKITNPFRLDPLKQGMTSFSAYMGSPVVTTEKLVGYSEAYAAFEGMTKLLSSGVLEKENDFGRKSAGGLQVKQCIAKYPGTYEATGLKNVKCIEDDNIPLGKRITSLIPFETGGINSIAPLILGAKNAIPVLDADGMGRAFPKLQMFTPYIYGCANNFSFCLADSKGKVVAISHCDSVQVLEVVARDACIEMGSSCACMGTPITFSEVLNNCVIHPISTAWCLGRAVQRGQIAKIDPVKSMFESVRGKVIIKGKVTEISNVTKGGFDYGFVVIQGLEKYFGNTVKVLFQNENLVVHNITDGNSNATKENIMVTTPDIISALDAEKGEVIPNEEIKYGVKVTLVALEANPLLLTEKALKVVGPRAFGFEFDYIPFNSS